MKSFYFRFSIIPLIACLGSCSTLTKPCREGGDTSWPKEFKGDQHCFQKKNAQGQYVNHGTYKRFNLERKVVLHGEFKDGKKNGYWTEYNDQGDKVIEKYFEMGVEKAPPSNSPAL